MNTYTLTVKDDNGTEKSITLSAKDNEELIMASNLFEKRQNETNEKAEQIKLRKALREMWTKSPTEKIKEQPLLFIGLIVSLLLLMGFIMFMSYLDGSMFH